MTLVNTSRGKIHVSEVGAGDPLLLLPANPGTHRDFDAVVPELARRYRTIAVDWPGYGESPPPDPPSSASAMSFAATARELVESLDLRGVTVLGNSVGGYSAIRLALECPGRVRALVLAAPGGFTEPSASARTFCWLKGREAVTRVIATRFAARYLRSRNAFAREVLERTEQGRKNPRSVAVDAAVWRTFSHPDHDLREAARGVAVPTLLAWGRHDPVVRLSADGAAARRAMPHAELAVFPTGHMPFVEAPEEFLAAMLEFLSRVPRSEAA